MRTIDITELILLISLVALAVVTVEARKLRRAVIYMGAFSLLSSFVYLLYNAPDVAIAEAFIGCTISVVLFLTALKRYRIITIYFASTKDAISRKSEQYCEALIGDLEDFLSRQDFEPQLIKTDLYDTSLHEEEAFDLLVVNLGDSVTIYSSKNNYHTPMISQYLYTYPKDETYKMTFISLKEAVDYEN